MKWYWWFIIIFIIIVILAYLAAIVGGTYINKQAMGAAEAYKLTRLRMDDNWLDLLQDGKKKVDVRMNRTTFDKLDKGSRVLYFSGIREVTAKVNKKTIYEKGIEELLKKEKITDIFPGEKMTTEEAKSMFLSKQQGGKGFYKEEDLNKPFIALYIEPCC